jgi:hypothetical protein
MDVYDATAPEYKTLQAIREVISYVEKKNIAKSDIGCDCYGLQFKNNGNVQTP